MENAGQSHFRLVDHYSMHGGRARLGERIDELVPADAEYVVFDLDRTVHLGITIGECLGWELLGDPDCRAALNHRGHGPAPLFAFKNPVRSAAGLARGMHHWGIAGLFYAGTVRLGDRWPAWDRFLASSFGPEYVDDIQAILRSILMASTAGYTRHQLRTYASRAWTRWQRRLVIDPEVVRAIRRRCPRLRAVIISSASTEPTVEHAAETLGVDGHVSSAVDVYRVDDDEIFSAPVGIPAWLRRGRPKFFSRPGAVMHNSSSKKVSLLRMNYPEVFARNSVSVAITDNNYGEDRSWPHHFRHVVALNSRHPFSPILPADSPCETIRIADATPIGMQAPAGRRFGWHGKLAPKSLDAPELSARLGVGAAHELESLRDRLRTARERASSEVDGSLRQRLASVGGELAETVDHYNRAAAREKPAIARSVYGLVRELKRVRAELDRAGRECARIRHEMERVHSRAAAALVTRGA